MVIIRLSLRDAEKRENMKLLTSLIIIVLIPIISFIIVFLGALSCRSEVAAEGKEGAPAGCGWFTFSTVIAGSLGLVAVVLWIVWYVKVSNTVDKIRAREEASMSSVKSR